MFDDRSQLHVSDMDLVSIKRLQYCVNGGKSLPTGKSLFLNCVFSVKP